MEAIKHEQQLISDCQQGLTDSFGKLYDTYIERIYAFVYYKTHHRETAEDLTSKAFVKALKNIKKFNADRGTFQAWLYQIARNTVIDHYRAQKNDKNIEDVWDMTNGEDVSDIVHTSLELEKVSKYLQTLQSEQRDILIMRLWQGMSHKEIADALGKSEASCKMAYSRALSELRQQDIFAALLLLGVLLV